MRKLTTAEITREAKKLHGADKEQTLEMSVEALKRIQEIKKENGHIFDMKYIDEMLQFVLNLPVSDLLKLDGLNRLRRDVVRHDAKGVVTDAVAILAKIDAEIAKFEQPEIGEPEEESVEEDLSFESVSEMQDENARIFENAIGAVDMNIDKVYKEADPASRIATFMAAFTDAISSYAEKQGVNRKEARRLTLEFCKTLVEIDELAAKKGSREDKLPEVSKIAERFNDAANGGFKH